MKMLKLNNQIKNMTKNHCQRNLSDINQHIVTWGDFPLKLYIRNGVNLSNKWNEI
jgi:hypothetical protein